MHWPHFLNPIGPLLVLWKSWDTKCKVPAPTLPLFFFLSLTWKLLRPRLVFWLFGALIGIVAFLLAGIALNMAQVFGLIFVFLDNLCGIDLSGWMAFLTAFMTFVFFRNLDLRLTINRRRVLELSLILVFVSIPILSIGVIRVFLHQWPIIFWAPKVGLPSPRRWL